jgi:hypothetical protein
VKNLQIQRAMESYFTGCDFEVLPGKDVKTGIINNLRMSPDSDKNKMTNETNTLILPLFFIAC